MKFCVKRFLYFFGNVVALFLLSASVACFMGIALQHRFGLRRPHDSAAHQFARIARDWEAQWHADLPAIIDHLLFGVGCALVGLLAFEIFSFAQRIGSDKNAQTTEQMGRQLSAQTVSVGLIVAAAGSTLINAMPFSYLDSVVALAYGIASFIVWIAVRPTTWILLRYPMIFVLAVGYVIWLKLGFTWELGQWLDQKPRLAMSPIELSASALSMIGSARVCASVSAWVHRHLPQL